ncbi:MAG: hypothetical protein R3E79_07455 [Caldilineaceae bacterium]
MTPKAIFVFLSKLILGGLAFSGGLMLGGMIAAMSGLPTPTLPPEMNADRALLTMVATSPLLVLALYFVGRDLAGGWLARTGVLALLAWIAYTLNNVIEAVFFSSYATVPAFTLINFTPGVLLCAGVTAWLFPPRSSTAAFVGAWQAHFAQRTGRAWIWRLLLAAVSFMPIYYGFGLLVVPFVGDYYQQGTFGLAAPPLATLLAVLLVRSILFLLACLPVVVAWQGAKWQLGVSLGFALFVLVGLLYMLVGNWLPPSMRLIHSLEILADSFVHAGVLVWLLGRPTRQSMRATEPEKWYDHQLGFR